MEIVYDAFPKEKKIIITNDISQEPLEFRKNKHRTGKLTEIYPSLTDIKFNVRKIDIQTLYVLQYLLKSKKYDIIAFEELLNISDLSYKNLSVRLDNLWKAGKARKFATGLWKGNNKPFGVHYQLKEAKWKKK